MPHPKVPRVFIVLLLGFACSAGAAWDKAWQRFEVQAHLDNAGVVEISQRMTIKLTGDMETLECPLSTATDQTIVLQKLVREDAAGEQALSEGNPFEPDRYDMKDGVLRWCIKPPGREWQEETLVFRVEYGLRGALDPAWDIPAGRAHFGEWSEFWKFPARIRDAFGAWRDAGSAVARRYRYEHEITFPAFPASGPLITNYTLHFDEAWVQVHPDAPFGTKMPECYRITQLMEFQQPGRPPAVDLRKPAVRVGSLIAVAAVAALLSGIFVIHELRTFGLHSPRIDPAWFAENIARQPPEVLAWISDHDRMAMCFPHFLGRMRSGGALSVQTVPNAEQNAGPKVTLRQLGNTAGLQPYERKAVESLFPNGPESGTDVLAKKYADDGFSPEAALADAVAAQYAETNPPGVWMPSIVGWMLTALGFAGAALVMYAVFQGSREWRLCFRALGIGAVIAVAPILLRAIPAWRGSRRLMLATIAWVALAVLLLVALHFGTNLPLSVFASAGLGLYWIAAFLFLFLSMRTVESPAHARRKREAARATNYARRQLRRPSPALSNAWLPQLRALGLGNAIKQWRERSGKGQLGAFQAPESQATGLPPFTGVAAPQPEFEWADALSILSKEDAEDYEKEKAEDAG